jgi:hypothetical protein
MYAIGNRSRMLASAVKIAGATIFSSSDVRVEVNLMSTGHDRAAIVVPGFSNVFATGFRCASVVVLAAADISLQRRQLETDVQIKVVAPPLSHKSVLRNPD